MIIGVTGSLATGKSTAARYLARYLKGHIIDADRLTHLALKKTSPAYKRLISCFGKDILGKKGEIDRRLLAEKAFKKKGALKRLCDILHPIVIAQIRKRASYLQKRYKLTFIIIDAPLLIESGLHKECDKVVTVISSFSLQIERSRSYRNIGPKEAMQRIRLQMPLSKKVRFADYIIDNDGSLNELRQGCKNLADRIKSASLLR